ncbi:MAG: bifunctional adenosylcobinamide kinase/adenosylcobinamide-phosphate guanylyltransferase [Alphaproteobacteria bacterium]
MLTAKSTFVLGGASSGKSAYAEELVLRLPGAPVYIATAQGFDEEMMDKIASHRRRRGDAWATVEEPYDLPDAIVEHGGSDTVLLVDCLTLWLTNIMTVERNIADETDALIAAINRVQGRIVLVSNELGLGLVPSDELSRAFRNLHGNLNQTVAAAVDRAVFIAAGLPLTLKDAWD